MTRTTLPDILIVLALSLMFIAGLTCGTKLCVALIVLGAGAAALAVAMLSAPDAGEGEAVDDQN